MKIEHTKIHQPTGDIPTGNAVFKEQGLGYLSVLITRFIGTVPTFTRIESLQLTPYRHLPSSSCGVAVSCLPRSDTPNLT